MTLPDAVLAFKLLDMACLDEKNRQLALTACTNLTSSSMKSALKWIFWQKNTMHVKGNTSEPEQRQRGRGKQNTTLQSGQQRPPLLGINPLDKFSKRPQ